MSKHERIVQEIKGIPSAFEATNLLKSSESDMKNYLKILENTFDLISMMILIEKH